MDDLYNIAKRRFLPTRRELHQYVDDALTGVNDEEYQHSNEKRYFLKSKRYFLKSKRDYVRISVILFDNVH